jgi:hypothetical protein
MWRDLGLILIVETGRGRLLERAEVVEVLPEKGRPTSITPCLTFIIYLSWTIFCLK